MSFLKWFVLVLICRLSLGALAAPIMSNPFICGVDLSFLQQTQDAGGQYFDASGAPVDALTFFHDQGVNYVRLRLWVAPADGYNDLDHTLALAKQIKALGMGLLIDFHYSDTWADPSHQTKPAAWSKLSFTALKDMLYRYTVEVISALKAQGASPDMVQIGNEITTGILWEDGHVDGENNWPNLIALLQAGAQAVRDSAPEAQIMLHIDRGGNQAVSQWFFDHMGSQVDFDIIGLSYYPWWSGSLNDLEGNLGFLAQRYGKPVVIAETGYPWTLKWSDNTHNLVGESGQLASGYPATPQGQTAFMEKLVQDLQNMPNGLGGGFFYWEPDALSAPNFGSFWENVAQFDFQGKALPSVDVYGRCRSQ